MVKIQPSPNVIDCLSLLTDRFSITFLKVSSWQAFNVRCIDVVVFFQCFWEHDHHLNVTLQILQIMSLTKVPYRWLLTLTLDWLQLSWVYASLDLVHSSSLHIEGLWPQAGKYLPAKAQSIGLFHYHYHFYL